MWPKIRSRIRRSVVRLSLKASQRRQPENTPAITAATAISPVQYQSDSPPITPWSTAWRVSRGTATLLALHASPTTEPMIEPATLLVEDRAQQRPP